MLQRKVYVRAKDPTGRWGSFDVMDLTDESFKLLILDKLVDIGVFVAMKPQEGDPDLDLHSKVYKDTGEAP